MVERRSMTDAMALTPEKLAFIHGDQAKPEQGSKVSRPQVVEVQAPGERVDSAKQVKATPPERRRGRRPKTVQPALVSPVVSDEAEGSQFLPPLLASITTRLSPATAEALRRAALEQKLKRRRPHTQQEI